MPCRPAQVFTLIQTGNLKYDQMQMASLSVSLLLAGTQGIVLVGVCAVWCGTEEV